MRSKIVLTSVLTLVAVLLSFGLSRAQNIVNEPLAPAAAPNDTFTYQGSLVENGNPASGVYDFQASIWDSSSGGTKKSDCNTSLTQNISVDHGLFSFVCAPLTNGAFNGSDRYMEVEVKKDSSGTYTTLPRQSITPVPYAWSLRPRQSITPVPYAWSLRPGATIADETSSVTLNVFGSVFGLTWKEGLYATAEDDTIWVYGIYARGINSSTLSSRSALGVYGSARAEGSNNAYGLYGAADPGTTGSGYAVYGYGDAANEISGFFTNTLGISLRSESDIDHAIEGIRYGSNTSAIYAYNYGTGAGFFGLSRQGNGIQTYTDKSDQNYGVYTSDNLYSLNYHLRGAMMRVVQNGGSEPLEAGDVVVFSGIDSSPDGVDVPMIRVSRATSANSTAVAGVVYSRFDLAALPADGDDNSPGGELTPAGPIQPGEYLLLVVEGPALVKTSAVAGALQPGDLLATSEQPGYAGKAASVTMEGIAIALPGATFGKALEALSEGAKLLYVYVTLK